MRSTRSFPRLDGIAVLSPMAGVTDVAFRALCRQYGASMTYTEFVSSTAIVRANEKTKHMLVTHPCENPVAVQLFGANEEDVVEAAKIVEPDFDVIDINCGCPAWKVIKTGAGSELLKEPQKIARFVNKLCAAVQKPVTVKIRAGIDDAHINAVEIAKLLEDAGASAIAIHGRTQRQGYSGKANWDIIRQVKDAVQIPVIGNGDIFDAQTAYDRVAQSGVDAVMIARGAIGNPLIFSQVRALRASRADVVEGSFESSPRQKLESFFAYASLAREYNLPASLIKTHALSFTKGLVGSSRLRESLNHMCDVDHIEDELRVFCETLRD